MRACELKGKTINSWLTGLCGNIQYVNPDDVFANYKPLDRGNTKLCNNILSFSLLPMVTCGGKACTGCYDLRSQRHPSVRKKRYVNTALAMHDSQYLADLIVAQLLNSKTCKICRIHVGGDFFSTEYVQLWIDIYNRVHAVKPNIQFYTYTKGENAKLLKNAGINVVRSLYPEGYNFGTMEYLKPLVKKYKGYVCPATLGKVPNKFCGNKCKACVVKENVFFKLH